MRGVPEGRFVKVAALGPEAAVTISAWVAHALRTCLQPLLVPVSLKISSWVDECDPNDTLHPAYARWQPAVHRWAYSPRLDCTTLSPL